MRKIRGYWGHPTHEDPADATTDPIDLDKVLSDGIGNLVSTMEEIG